MTEADKHDGENAQIDLDAYRIGKAKDRLEALDLDPQVIEDFTTVLKADFDVALQKGMEEVGVPMSMRIKINQSTRKILSEQNSE